MPEADFRIAGVRVRFESDRDDFPFRAVCDDLGALRCSQSSPDVRLKIYPRGWDEPSPLKLSPSARLIRDGSRKVYQDGERFFIDYHGNAFFTISGFEAEGVCYGDERLDPIFWTEVSINHMIFLLLRLRGIFLLHSGGAVGPDGRAILFVGPNGAGKSTAALRLAKEGWPYLGDDITFFDRKYRIYPHPKRPAVTDWTLDALSLEDRVVATRRTGKKILSPWKSPESVSGFRLYYPLAGNERINRLRPVPVFQPRDFLISQTELCHTDKLIGGPAPDPAPFLENFSGLEIGALEELPGFLRGA